jgi:hypothetical protein
MKTLNSEELSGFQHDTLDRAAKKPMLEQIEFKVLFLAHQKLGDEVLHQIQEEVKSKIRDQADENAYN